jgi:hypothetical protein
LEIIHIYRPGHGSKVTFLLYEAHLYLHTGWILIANPLCS